MKDNRAEQKDDVFMGAAAALSTLATCDRKHVGAVLVKDSRIISTGYNGAPSGMPHCDDDGHMMVDGHCVRTIHAEMNAILQVGVIQAKGSTLYTTASPCWPCFQTIVQARITRIVFRELYRDVRIFKFAQEAGIQLDYFRTCCKWHRHNPGPWKSDQIEAYRIRGMRNLEDCRCLDEDKCPPCWIESHGCGCNGALDDGCFLCTPEKHKRPPCPTIPLHL